MDSASLRHRKPRPLAVAFPLVLSLSKHALSTVEGDEEGFVRMSAAPAEPRPTAVIPSAARDLSARSRPA